MSVHPEHWPIAKRFSYEFGNTARHLLRFRNAYCLGASAVVLSVSAITWARTDASASDLPIIIMASIIHLLRIVAVASLLFAWVGAYLVQEWLYARASNAWCKHESLRRPGESFQVPHWRFYIPAAIARFIIFGVWIGSLFCLLYVLPSRVSWLKQLIPSS